MKLSLRRTLVLKDVNETAHNKQCVLLNACCIIALMPFLPNAQVSDTTGDATTIKSW